MCGTCGCGTEGDHAHHDHHHHHGPAARRVRLERDLLAKNDRIAADNRAWLARRSITAFNLIGAPGAGKTALLEATIARMGSRRFGVLEGDQATDRDAERIRRTGCGVVQINTGAGCHLDADMVARALDRLAPPPGTVLFVENVGNLVCPALFDLGERAKVAVISTTEGDDKPAKYPHVFRAAEVMVVTKLDLLPHVDFDVARCVAHARAIHPGLRVFTLSVRSGEGLEPWCAWLQGHSGREAVVHA